MRSASSILEPFAAQLLRTDSFLYDLPHPKLAQVLPVSGILESVVGTRGVHALQGLLKDLTKTKSRVVQEGCAAYPELLELRALCPNPNTLDFAHLELFLAPLRFWANGGRLFEVEPELDALLALTDIGDTAPLEYFRVPFPVTYFLLGAHGGGLKVAIPPKDEAPVLGVYVTELNGFADTPDFASYAAWAGPRGELTCYDITFVSRPLRCAGDLGQAFVRLYVGPQMRDLTVSEVLALNFKMGDERETGGASPETKLQLRAGVGHLTKVLLHLNSDGAMQRVVHEESDLAERLKGVKAKKFQKLHRRWERSYDRIVITHQHGSERDSAASPGRSLRTHWRRGHFRHQSFGPGRTQNKLRWIQPMLIGNMTSGGVETKEYVVQRPPVRPHP